MLMRIGDLRHRATVQAPTTVPNHLGEPVVTWAAEAAVWAEVLPVLGRELAQAGQVRADVTHAVKVRYREGLSPRHRLVVDGKVLQIESVVNPDGRKRVQMLACKEVV